MNGYIYIRSHPSYDLYEAYKMGKTKNIPETDIQYATKEIKRRIFEVILQVPLLKLNIIERLLQNEFNYLNIKSDGGTDFL